MPSSCFPDITPFIGTRRRKVTALVVFGTASEFSSHRPEMVSPLVNSDRDTRLLRSRSRPELLRPVLEILPRRHCRGVNPRGQVNLHGGGSIFPLHESMRIASRDGSVEVLATDSITFQKKWRSSEYRAISHGSHHQLRLNLGSDRSLPAVTFCRMITGNSCTPEGREPQVSVVQAKERSRKYRTPEANDHP